MKYMGSKNRLCKEIVPIIQSYINDNKIENYLEPFVDAANVTMDSGTAMIRDIMNAEYFQ